MDQDSKTITVIVAGRPYPLRVKENEEASVRNMVAEVTAVFNEFRMKYKDRDEQDCLVMTLLTMAADLRNTRKAVEAATDKGLSERIDQLDDLIEALL